VFVQQGSLLCEVTNRRLLAQGEAVPYRLFLSPLPDEDTEAQGGLAILSRLPVRVHNRNHIGRQRYTQRLRVAVAPVQWTDLVNTHLHFVSGEGALRARQVKAILDWLEKLGGVAQVLLGALSDVPGSGPLRLATSSTPHLHSAFAARHGREPEATYPTPLVSDATGLSGTIHCILVSDAIRVLEARLCFSRPAANDEELYPSDHFRLLADLAIQAGFRRQA